MRRLGGTLYRASIWHPEAIPAWEGQAARDLKRVVLPILDVLLVCMGVYAVRRGMPSFAIVWDAHLSSVASWVLLLAAAAALVGIAFPRAWAAEVTGKIAIFAILIGYAGALGWLDIIGQGDRGFVAFALAGVSVVPGWNLIRLGRERRARKAAEAAKRAIVAAVR